jgi:hypothetical protein
MFVELREEETHPNIFVLYGFFTAESAEKHRAEKIMFFLISTALCGLCGEIG